MGWQDDPVVGSMPWDNDPIVDAPASSLKARYPAEYDSSSPEFKEKYGAKRGALLDGMRQLGLAGRYAIEGGAALAQVPANALALGLDKTLEAAGSDYRFGNQSAALSNLLTKTGLPNPENRSEEVVGNLSRAVAGAGTGVGVGNVLSQAEAQVASAVGRNLAAQPLIQGASAITGTGAGEIAKDAGVGPYGQLAATLAGSVAPSAWVYGAQTTTRGLMRGGETGRQRVQENIDLFNRVGTAPSVGQATERRSMQATESMLSRAPGGAGKIIGKAESQAEELAAGLEKQAAQLVRKTSAEQAGRAIEKGVRGPNGFVERFKARQEKLYDALDKFIPSDKRIAVNNAKNALAELNAEIPGAPNVSRFFQNSKIRGIEGALKADTEGVGSVYSNTELNALFRKGSLTKDDEALIGELMADGNLPYEAVKKLRTLVGREMADSGLISDVPRSKWKALYAALSQDLGDAANAAGPGAQFAWNRANTYTKAGMGRLEAVESVIEKNGGPEAIFRAATAGTKEGATTLRAVMQSLDDEGKKMVSATVLRRLGLAKAGVQNELGDKFSTESFLTNWNMLSPEAKRTLFDRFGPGFRDDMDQVAKVAANLRQGSKVFVNPSGTAQAAAQYTTAGAFALAVITGNVGAAGAIAAGVTGANLFSRLMTNPEFVKWLARSTKMPVAASSASLNNLAQIAKDSKNEDLASAYLLLRDENDKRNENKYRQAN